MSLTESLRVRLRKVAGVCDKCGGPGMSLRKIGKESKVTHSTVYRFLQGKSITSAHLDRIATWVERKERITEEQGREAGA